MRALRQRGFPLPCSMGIPGIILSSGYVTVENLYRDLPDENGHVARRKTDGAMVLPLGPRRWPEGQIYLPGPAF